MFELRFQISTFVRQTHICGLSWFRPVVFLKTWLFWSPLGFLLCCHEKHNQSTAKRHGHIIVSALPLGKGPSPVCGLFCFYRGM